MGTTLWIQSGPAHIQEMMFGRGLVQKTPFWLNQAASTSNTASMEAPFAKTIVFAYDFLPFLLWRLWSGHLALSNSMGARYRFGCFWCVFLAFCCQNRFYGSTLCENHSICLWFPTFVALALVVWPLSPLKLDGLMCLVRFLSFLLLKPLLWREGGA